LQHPKILIIDNPYLGLDAPSRAEFNDLLDNLVKEEGIQLILAGQYEVLPSCITHRLVLNDFKIEEEGKLASAPLSAKKEIPAKRDVLEKIKSTFPPPTSDHPTIFELQQVSVQYGKKSILKSIDWHVQKGEKWALVGNNGSGKSTILSLLFGDHPQAYANNIHLFGQKRGMGQSIWDIKKNTGFTSPELHYFFSYDITCLKAVITGLFDHVYLKREPTAQEQQRIDSLFDYFELSHLKNTSFQEISTGEQRLILFIRALIKNPPLLLLDEPFQAFDRASINKAKLLLDEILTDEHTLVFISHYKSEIPSCVDRVAYLEEGVLSSPLIP